MTTTELRELLAQATPGPWFCATAIPFRVGSETTGELVADAVKKRNSALIVAAINALPALLDLAEAAKVYADAHDRPVEWADYKARKQVFMEAVAKLESAK